MTVTRTDQPDVTLAAVRATVPTAELRSFYDSAYPAVAGAVHREGWTIVGGAVGWYHRMPSDTADVTVGFPVTGAVVGAASGEVDVVELPGGPALVATHVGGYDGLEDAWAGVEEHRVATGVAGRGDFWEEYLTEPQPDGDPDENVTRLVLPLTTG